MKFGITRYEQFALTSHLVGQPSPNPEHGRKRLRAWDELRVADLADTLATMSTGFGGEIRTADWSDKKTPHLIDLNADVLDFVLAGLGQQVSGVWVDVLGRLRERLEALRDKKYELPPELRTT
jgi:hypothetical protein